MSSSILSWGEGARVVLDGVPSTDAAEIASRWGASVVTDGATTPGDQNRLVVSGGVSDAIKRRVRSTPPRVNTRFRDDLIEVGVGRHRVFLDPVAGLDSIVVGGECGIDDAEWELLLGVAIGHLLARQGLVVLHACAFECRGMAVLGLGESLAGKTTVSMAAVRAGGAVVSDDLVLAGVGPDGRVELRPLRNYWFLRGSTRQIIPTRLTSEMWETDENGEPRWVIPHGDRNTGTIDRSTPETLWLLSVDRRLHHGRVAEVSQARSFAALIGASSPVFLSRYCPHERRALMPVLRALSEGCRGFRVRLGRGLLDDPESEMVRLLFEEAPGSSRQL